MSFWLTSSHLQRVARTHPSSGLWGRRPIVFIALLSAAMALLVSACAGIQTPTVPPTPGGPPTSVAPAAAPTAAQQEQTPGASSTTTNAPGSTSAAAQSDWTTYHRDSARTGYLSDWPDPTSLSLAWNTKLDGAVYAEPLVVGGHVIVATEGNSIYSLQPDTGKIEWRTNIGQPVPRSALPCGNIDPLGITGTPVYDPAAGLVFAVAEVSGPAHTLVGVDLKTGAVRVRRSANPEGMEARPHQQRAALALSQGMVYIAFGGLFGDCGNYRGRVIASRTDGTGPLLSYQVPTGREGGIWAPPGPAIDAQGRLYVSVGNGSEAVGNWDHSDSVLRLSPSLQLEDGFAPDRWRQDNLTDADLGSLGPVLLPGGTVFIAGKAGIGYWLNANALGGVGGQILQKPVCHAYGGAAVVGSTMFIPCNEGVQQLVGSGKDWSLGWQAKNIPGSPVVGGHTLYSLDRSGTLHALALDTGQPRATVAVGPTTRFATPTLSGDHIFIGTTIGLVAISPR